MKRITFFILVGITTLSFAQEKESVYSIVEEIHDSSWYETQFELWKQDATKGSKSPEAWYNYYAACRALINLTEGEERKQYGKTGKKIAEDFLAAHPNTFEANYVAMWSSGLSDKIDEYLWKAYEINPNDPRLLDNLLVSYEIDQKEQKREEVANKMIANNYLANGVMNWGYNVLSELEDGAIVITAGDNDSYALWLNRYGLKHRTDVTILNMHMLMLPDYRERYFNKLGLEPIDEKELTLEKLIAHVMKNKKGIPVHIANTAFHYIQGGSIDSNLYLTGLTYQYSEDQFDNSSLIRRNYEQRYALDYLELKFTTHRMDRIAKSFDYTYVASMVKLFKMYECAGETTKMKKLGKLLETVSENGPMAEDIQKIIH